MRLVIVGPTHPYKGGIAKHTTQLAHRLAAAGHETQIWSWSEQYPARLYPGQQRLTSPETEPFAHTRYPLSWRRPDGWWRTGRQLRAGQVDAVVIVSVTPLVAPAYVALLRAAGRRVAAVALCHNVLPHERRRVDEPLTRALLGRVGAVLVHSAAERATAQRLTDAPVLIAELPPLGLLATARVAQAAARRTLLFFGIVRRYKGLDVLLHALCRTPDDIRLVVAGEFWDDEAETRALIDALGLAGRVDLRPGYVDPADVPDLFAATDALVLPYRSATSSANVQIAHSHGAPVIATAVGTFPDQVRDGVDGFVVPPEDPAALAQAIDRLYQPRTLERLRAGVPRVDADAAWSAYVDRLTAAIDTARRPEAAATRG